MTPEQKRHIASAMLNRSRQWKLRLVLGVVVSLAFFPLAGAVITGFWLTAYVLIQFIERRFHPDGPLAVRLGERYSSAAIGLVFVSNVVFGALGGIQVFSGTIAGITCAGLLAGGAIVNAVLISPGSRHLMLAAFLPQVAYILLVPTAGIVIHHDPVLALQLMVASGLMLAACIVAWGHLARTFAAMEAAQAQAEEANRAKSDFLATMSHEIRTPLNGVLGMAQAMAADQLSGRQRERLDVVTQSGQALLTILNDVLDLAKIEARKIELELAEFDLETLVERSQETFRAIADSKGLAFDTRIDSLAIGAWRGDATRLRQILSNLISNAVKFTDQGRVSVIATVADGRLRLVVEDTGPGVTPEQLPRLFKKFIQADASTTRRYGGTGLGLSICGELAALMGGTVVAEHVEPQGLRFTLDVPVERMERSPQASGIDVLSIDRNDDRDARALRVLAAEDHPVNRQVLTLLLSQAGIIPHIVENGAEAVDAWRDGDWDLILMDVQMPVMDGPTAARIIRSEERATGRAGVPIIALTANVMTHQIEDYRQAGMETFVAKPIQVQALLDGIQAAIAAAPVVRAGAAARAA